MEKTLLIFGPSGSGKSTVGKWLQEDLNFLHIEADCFPDGDGIDINNLRSEWDLFYNSKNPGPLFEILKDRAKKQNKNGCVLTLPSTIVEPVLLSRASKFGLVPIILYGSGAECLNSFLDREKTLLTPLTKEHWIKNNRDSYAAMGRPEYAEYRILAFKDGERKSRDEMVNEISKMADN